MLAFLTLLTVGKVKILEWSKWIITSNACLFNTDKILSSATGTISIFTNWLAPQKPKNRGYFLLALSCAVRSCKKTFFLWEF